MEGFQHRWQLPTSIFSLLLCIAMGHLDCGTAPQIGRTQYLNQHKVLFWYPMVSLSINKSHSHGNSLETHKEKKKQFSGVKDNLKVWDSSPPEDRKTQSKKQSRTSSSHSPPREQSSTAQSWPQAAPPHLRSSSGCWKRGVCFTESSPMINVTQPKHWRSCLS